MSEKKRNVSKQIFLNSIACPTYGWLMRSGRLDKEIGELTLGEKFRIEQGFEIQRIARTLYPQGILVDDHDLDSAVKRTSRLLNDTNVFTIFEATFLVDGCAAKTDILQRTDAAWEMVEVKSSVNDKPEFIDDMAYTFLVSSHSGVALSKVSLQLVSRDFRLGMSNEHLFAKIDHTDDVVSRAAIFEPFMGQVEEMTRRPIMPEPELRFECRACPIFEECCGKNINNHVFEIPRLSQPKFAKLQELGIYRIEDIPDGFPLTENQAKVRDCVKTHEVFVGPEIREELEAIEWPTYCLDFETVQTAIPLYPNIAPYSKLPTQYSIHKCSAPGKVTNHFEYMSDPSRDGRRELTKHLIEDLEKEGTIITYSSFEKTILNALSETYPDLSAEIGRDIDRIIDLGAIIAKHYYHPEFHGSTSIKTTLPVCVPSLTYDDLKIKDGDCAEATFAYLALGKFRKEDVDPVKKNLLDYCERDTLALVKLHEHLSKIC
jgi:hypothetical protein